MRWKWWTFQPPNGLSNRLKIWAVDLFVSQTKQYAAASADNLWSNLWGMTHPYSLTIITQKPRCMTPTQYLSSCAGAVWGEASYRLSIKQELQKQRVHIKSRSWNHNVLYVQEIGTQEIIPLINLHYMYVLSLLLWYIALRDNFRVVTVPPFCIGLHHIIPLWIIFL